MNLNLNKAFAGIMRWGGKSPDKDSDLPVSMVLLLRESRFITLDQLRLAGERAFGVSFAGGKGSEHYVLQEGLFTLMRTGPHMLSFLNYTKPYDVGSGKFAGSMPKASQRRAWAEHAAWTAVDYVRGGVDLELEYGVLAKLSSEMLDDNCAGLYVPREQSFIPNDGSLREGLRRNSKSAAGTTETNG
jgi:hypothetical protein